MSTTTAPHEIVVTKVPDDVSDDVEYEITCPTPQPDRCRVWWECEVAGPCRPLTEQEKDEGIYTAHEAVHRLFDGAWMTESTDCALSTTDSGSDSTRWAAERLGLGAHQLDVDYEGDGCWEAVVVSPEVTR